MNKSTLIKIGIAVSLACAIYFLVSNMHFGSAPEQKATQNENDPFCLKSCPSTPPGDIIVRHHVLVLSNNPKTKFADWVAYKITADTIGSHCVRKWEVDSDLDPATTLRPSDYRGLRAALASDRGHQAPLDSLCASPYWQELDYLSNITPQKTNLNEGPWERLEEGERKLIKNHYADAVYSITGPLYERDMPKLPYAHEDHVVPSGYWKIVSIKKGADIEAVAFIMDQETARGADYCSTNVSIGELENRAHEKVFPEIIEPARDALEKGKRPTSLWVALGC